jgi:hypothetical protein
MNVEIGAEAALFPEKEYINGIAVAVRSATSQTRRSISIKSSLKIFRSICMRIDRIIYKFYNK